MPHHYVDADTRMLFIVAGKHIGKEASQGLYTQPDSQASFLAARQCASGLHGMVKLVNTGGNARTKVVSGLGQPDAW